MSYYTHHVFFCLNVREEALQCCGGQVAENLFAYAKAYVKNIGLHGKGKIRINKAGCLDRCAKGPLLVIYPEETWYQCRTEADIKEIIDKHCVENVLVSRLQIM